MGAPIGNLFALGNKGGRPPAYTNSDDLYNDICEYFEHIQGELGEKEVNSVEINEKGESVIITEIVEYWVRQPERPTITGISLFLGFADKSSFYEYKTKDEFSYLIKRATTQIENYHENKVAEGDKCVGNIFVLKNMGWKDKQEIEMGGEVNIPIKKWVE